MNDNSERIRILNKVVQCMGRVFKQDEGWQLAITENTGPSTIAAWNSLGHLNLILCLEEAFNTQFTDDEVIRLTSVGRIVDLLILKGA